MSADLLPNAKPPPGTATGLERTALGKVTRRLIPFLFVLYIVAFLDRVNVGFAALQINRDLGFSPAVYGFGAGVFFVGYALFEVPSNLILCRTGARAWIARIMITWGLLSAAMMFVRGPISFYALRFLLGVAEAGFLPGIIFYLSGWFPAAERARAIARFMTAIPLSSVVGGPLAGALLGLNGRLGLAGWQWLFLVEGLPAVLLGVVVLGCLTDCPEHAAWLAPEERAWLSARLRQEQEHCTERHHVSLRQALTHGLVWQLGLIYLLAAAGGYGLTLWVPAIVRSLFGLSDLMVGVVSALPYVAAAVAMMLIGAHSDRTGERCLHVAVPTLVGALGLLGSAVLRAPPLVLFALTVAVVGIYSRNGPFWALPSVFLTGSAAAGGIALINTVGQLGGFVGPYAVGLVKGATGGFGGGLLLLAGLVFGSGLLALGLRHAPALGPVPEPTLSATAP